MNRAFHNVGKITALTLIIAFSPAYAGGGLPNANLLKYSSADAEQWVMGGCNETCKDKVAIVSYGGGKPYAKANYNAAKRLHDEGKPVVFIMARDNNNEPLDAVTRTYVNGKSVAEVTLDATKAFLNDDMVKVQGIEDSVYQGALDTYNDHLKSILQSQSKSSSSAL